MNESFKGGRFAHELRLCVPMLSLVSEEVSLVHLFVALLLGVGDVDGEGFVAGSRSTEMKR